MKDARFTELVNLCLDHQISPPEAAELEAEILRSPARRREYREYCRLQEGCVRLFEREMSHAPASFALESSLLEVERLVSESPRPVYGRRLVVALAGCAGLAACLTLALVVMRPARFAPNPNNPAGLSVATVAAPHQGLARSGAFVMPAAGAPDEYQAVAKLGDWRGPVVVASADAISTGDWIQFPGMSSDLPAVSVANFDASALQAPAVLDGLNVFDPANAPEVRDISFQFTK